MDAAAATSPDSTAAATAAAPAKAPRSRRRRVLRGQVTVHHSTRVRFPKLHVDPACEGLERTPEEARATLRFANAEDLAGFDGGRPCRMCTLEPLLRTLLTTPTGDRALVTFSSQPNPLSPDGSVFTYTWDAATPSGEARLRRLARSADLRPVGTPWCGLVVVGLVPTTAVQALVRNLRCHVLDPSPTLPSSEAVETFWALISDAPPQLDAALDQAPRLEHWRTALALAG